MNTLEKKYQELEEARENYFNAVERFGKAYLSYREMTESNNFDGLVIKHLYETLKALKIYETFLREAINEYTKEKFLQVVFDNINNSFIENVLKI